MREQRVATSDWLAARVTQRRAKKNRLAVPLAEQRRPGRNPWKRDEMKRMRRLLGAFLWLLLFFFAINPSLGGAQAKPSAPGTIVEVSTPPAIGAQVVKVGMYVNTVYQLEIESSTYYLDAYLWLKWNGEIDPAGTLELTNLVEEWGAMVTPLNEEPITLPDGSQYRLLKIEGRFMQPFVLADYPLDRQRLSVYIEDNTYGADTLVYEMDSAGSGFGHMLAIPGWQIESWSSQQLEHDYGSFFGAEGAGGASTYSTLRFDLEIARPVNFFIFKLMLPLLIILAASWMVLVLHPRLVDARTALPGMGLLTAVFLQQAYSDGLPEVGYLVLIDKIYAVAYAMIVLTLLRAIWTSRGDIETAADIAQARRTDRLLLATQVVVFTGAVVAILTLR
jgi:hypothetical protein